MPHFVTPKISGGDYPYLDFTCTEEPGATCKLVCPTNADDPYSCEVYRLEWIDGEPWHVGWSAEHDDERPLHKMLPTSSCTFLEFDALSECFAGKDAVELRRGEVTFSWSPDDESYVWEYAKPADVEDGA